jgi:cbb3-type cytochrome oxidase subunit 1
MINTLIKEINLSNLVTNVALLGILGFLVKRWINGTTAGLKCKVEQKDYDEECKRTNSRLQSIDNKVETFQAKFNIGGDLYKMFQEEASFRTEVRTRLKINAKILREDE